MASLSIKNGTINEPFNSETVEYTANVTEETEKIEVAAVANVQDAKVEITGQNELKEGENIVTIIVTSADGTDTRKYTIKVTKKVDLALNNNTVNSIDNNTTLGTTNQTTNDSGLSKKVVIICGIAVFIIVNTVAIIIIKYKNGKEDNLDEISQNNEEDDEDEDDEDDDDNENIEEQNEDVIIRNFNITKGQQEPIIKEDETPKNDETSKKRELKLRGKGKHA